MRPVVATALVGLVAGGLLGWLLAVAARDDARRAEPAGSLSAGGVPPASGAHTDATGSAEADRLRAELERERVLREALADEIEILEALLAEASEAAGDAAEASRDSADGPRAGRPGDAGPEEPWFDADALGRLDYSPAEIERLRELWEASVLERLELDNERMRAGETGMRYALRDALAVQRRLRERVGDEDYDALLYASGERNRVVVSQMLERSPGAAAGLEAGDAVISYAGERVFRPIELKSLTAAGPPGESVEMRVLRDGEVVRVFVDRGPLGVQLRTESRPPVR